jgi:quercetin dioxygenase-like cupin family protein
MHGHGEEALQVERQTHGSDQRSPRQLSVPLRRVDIAAVADRLRTEPAFATDGRNAETIHDDGGMRVMVGVVAAGRDIGARQSDGYVTISLPEGRGVLRRGDEEIEVTAGDAAVLAPGAAWAFEATEPAVLMAAFWAFGEDDGRYRSRNTGSTER